jgi:hypothetical protein
MFSRPPVIALVATVVLPIITLPSLYTLPAWAVLSTALISLALIPKLLYITLTPELLYRCLSSVVVRAPHVIIALLSQSRTVDRVNALACRYIPNDITTTTPTNAPATMPWTNLGVIFISLFVWCTTRFILLSILYVSLRASTICSDRLAGL